ncbi:thymocyte nuclear protein 1-like, partial [Trifolium medium]|nr:thymocyte nuclear protein 1-like [Trifolium medium]
KARRIVGVVSVVREWYTDEGEEGGGAVDVKAVGEMRRAVDLKEMKHLKDFVLLKQPRLSVVPVPDLIWDTICH